MIRAGSVLRSLYQVPWKKIKSARRPHGVPPVGDNGRDNRRTYDWIIEDDEKGSIVDPLDLEATPLVFKFGEGSLDVPRLELGREAG